MAGVGDVNKMGWADAVARAGPGCAGSVSDGAQPTIAGLRFDRQRGTRALKKSKSWSGETPNLDRLCHGGAIPRPFPSIPSLRETFFSFKLEYEHLPQRACWPDGACPFVVRLDP